MNAKYMRDRRARAVEESIALRADCHTPTPGWRNRTACTPDHPLDWWYESALIHHGKALCEACPVRVACTVTAMRSEATLPVKDIIGLIGIGSMVRRKHRLVAA